MEDDNQEYFLYKTSINIFEQAILQLSINLLQDFISINMKPSIKILSNKNYKFNSS